MTRIAWVCAVLLAGCASTTVTLMPSPQAAVCDRAARALVAWAPEWRSDQKDIADREVAAETGMRAFFANSNCFARSELRRLSATEEKSLAALVDQAASQFDRVVMIRVRELGPVVKLLSSPALIEGGTEVALHVVAYSTSGTRRVQEFTVFWRNGGPGVVKGVASLPDDMKAALTAGLQP